MVWGRDSTVIVASRRRPEPEASPCPGRGFADVVSPGGTSCKGKARPHPHGACRRRAATCVAGLGGQAGGSHDCPAGLLQLVLDLGAEVGDSGEPVHRLADDSHEPPVGLAGFVEQVGDAAVAGHGHVEQLMCVAVPTHVEVETAGLDVPEERHDDAVRRQGLPAAGQLPGDGQGRVLAVFVGDPGGERDRDHERSGVDVVGLVGDRDAVQVGQHLLGAAGERVGGTEDVIYGLWGSGWSAIHCITFRMI
jgi:hypothetical protein